MNQTIDVWDSANNPQTFSPDLWGKVNLQGWYCALVKGYGRVPFNPGEHDANQKRTAIDIAIDPLPELGISNPNICERHMIAESKEWRTITLASLRDLGIQDVRAINGKWAHILPTSNGRTYEKNGETRDSTDFKFLAIYETEEECRAAMSGNSDSASAPPLLTQYSPDGGQVNAAEKEAAAQFLKVIVENAIRGKQAEQYRDTLNITLAGFPMVNKFFTFDSPEVQALLPKAA